MKPLSLSVFIVLTFIVIIIIQAEGKKKKSNKGCTNKGGTCKRNCDNGTVVRPNLCKGRKKCCLLDEDRDDAIAANPCASSPCENGGTCNALPGGTGYTCDCVTGFVGPQCETDICILEPCENGGTCNPTQGGRTCSCPAEYVGEDCQIEKTACFPNPCEHGASCNATDDMVDCACLGDYSGKYCQIGTIIDNIDDEYQLDFVNFAEISGTSQYHLYDGCTVDRSTVVNARLKIRSPALTVTIKNKVTTVTQCSGEDADIVYGTMSVSVYTSSVTDAADIAGFTGQEYITSSIPDGEGTKTVYVFTLKAVYGQTCLCD